MADLSELRYPFWGGFTWGGAAMHLAISADRSACGRELWVVDWEPAACEKKCVHCSRREERGTVPDA